LLLYALLLVALTLLYYFHTLIENNPELFKPEVSQVSSLKVQELGLVAHAYIHSSWLAETGGSSMCNTARSCLKKKYNEYWEFIKF
jgi:hypothetical protein